MLVGLLLIGLAGCHGKGGTEEAKDKEKEKEGEHEAHVTVTVEAARKSTVTETVDGLGRSEAIPTKLAMLTPAVQGHVHEILVKQGETVKKDQPIVELNKSVAFADLTEKTATRDGLKASLTLLKSLPRADERRPNELAIEQAKVALERAKQLLERLRPLLARHEVAEQQVFEAELAVTTARLQQESAEATLKMSLIGPRPEAVAEAEGKIAVAEGTVAFSKAHLDFHTIRAPIDGVLDSITCHPGQTIAIGTPIGEVVDTRQVYISLFLPARSAQKVRVGQKAALKMVESSSESAETEGKEPLTGKVEFVGRIADAQTGNLPILILVDNPNGRLSLGQTIGVTIMVEERAGVLQVPSAAILDLGEGPILSVVRDDKTVTLHPQVGPPHDGWVAVSGTDLKEGEPVIVEGGYNLPEGTEVKTEKAEPEKSDEHKDERKSDEHKDEHKIDEPKGDGHKTDDHHD
jgi:multidrug efflux pump subunit AcrA (membrane-fusion protein)